MNADALRNLVSAWPGVTADVKWGADLVFSVGGRMFCATAVAAPDATGLGFKVDADEFLALTDRPGVVPAPYLARAHWVRLERARAMPAAELRGRLRRSYELVRARLPKAQQRMLAD